MKPILNKWVTRFYFGRDYNSFEHFTKRIEFGIMKFHRIPEQGMMFTKHDYKGFWITIWIWFPIDF